MLLHICDANSTTVICMLNLLLCELLDMAEPSTKGHVLCTKIIRETA